MRKIILLAVLFVSLFTLSACNGTSEDDSVSVVFYTANRNADVLEAIGDLEVGGLLDKPEDPARLGYEFDQWYIDYARTTPWDFDTDVIPDASFVLYAGWIATELNIIYDLNGGTMVDAEYPEVFFAGEYDVLPIASRAGYQFVAWYTYDWEDESSTKAGDPGYQTIPEDAYEDLYLYAHWEAVQVRVTFRANHPDDSVENPSPLLVNYGSLIAFPQFDDTDGYSFVGWNTKSDGTGTFYEEGTVFERTQRITLYGVWEPLG